MPKTLLPSIVGFLLLAGATVHAAPILSISGPSSVSAGQSGLVYSVDVADDALGALDISGATIVVAFDSAVFAYVTAAAGALLTLPPDFFLANATATDVSLSIAVDFPGAITTAGSLALLTFDVLPGAPAGPSVLSFLTGDTQLVDSGLNPVSFSAESATVGVASGTAPIAPAWLLLGTGLAVLGRVRRVR